MRLGSLCGVLSACVLMAPVLASGININTADPVVLAEGLHGVGPRLADAIVSYREKYGPYASAEALADVKGVGGWVVEVNRDVIEIEIEIEKQEPGSGTSAELLVAPEREIN